MNYNKLGEYQFVTMDSMGKVGSIYYKYGRIRLVHHKGPTVDLVNNSEYILRFAVLENYEDYYKRYYYNNINDLIKGVLQFNGNYLLSECSIISQDIKEMISPSFYSNVAEEYIRNYILYEVYISIHNHQILYDHLSRGCPVNIHIGNDIVYKKIFNYAQSHYPENIKNDAVYGCFYGYFNRPPFHIYSPWNL